MINKGSVFVSFTGVADEDASSLFKQCWTDFLLLLPSLISMESKSDFDHYKNCNVANVEHFLTYTIIPANQQIWKWHLTQWAKSFKFLITACIKLLIFFFFWQLKDWRNQINYFSCCMQGFAFLHFFANSATSDHSEPGIKPEHDQWF